MLALGWRLSTSLADPVVWARRDANIIADHLVNYTMDSQTDWTEDSRNGLNAKDCSIVCHSDGGTRGQSCSGAAWFIEAVSCKNGRQQSDVLAMGGQFLEPAVSSFMAETIALDNAISVVFHMLTEYDR